MRSNPLYLRVICASIFFAFLSGERAAAVDTDGDGVNDTQEAVDQTDAADADSYLEHAGSEYCLNWDGRPKGERQLLELRNSSCGAVGGQIDLRGADGSVLGASNLSLAASEQSRLTVNSFPGFTRKAFGQICATITSGGADSLDARILTYRPERKRFDYAANDSYTVGRTGAQYLTYNHVLPHQAAKKKVNVAEVIRISNQEGSVQSGNLTFYKADGAALKTVQVSLAAKGSIEISVRQNAGSSRSGLIEWQPTLADRRFRLTLTRRVNDRAGKRISLSTLAAKRPSGALQGASLSTLKRTSTLELGNTLATPVSLNLQIFRGTGALINAKTISLPAKGSARVMLDRTLKRRIGNVQIEPVSAQSIIASVTELGEEFSGDAGFAIARNLDAGFGTTTSAFYDRTISACRLRVANLTGKEQTASLAMTRFDGTTLLSDTSIAVPANGVFEMNACNNDKQAGSYGRISLTPAATESLVSELLQIARESDGEFRVPFTGRSSCTAGLSVTPTLLELEINGTQKSITVTNDSAGITAKDIQAALPSGWTDVEQDASECTSVAPGGSCELHFIPGPAARAGGQISIAGSNTTTASAQIAIGAAHIGVSTNSLTLTAGSTAGTLTVTNNSTTITAINVQALLPSDWTDVTQDASDCASVAPGASCDLEIAPGNTGHSQTAITIQGTNTTASQVLVTVGVPSAILSLSGSPVLLFSNGSSQNIVVTNLSTITTATNISANLTGTALDGNVTETGNTCSSLAPSQSCTLTFTPAATGVSQTSFAISGTNTDTVNAAIRIVTAAAGTSVLGGVIGCLNGGLNNFIAATADNSTSIIWGDFNVTVGAGAQSDSDGATNTVTTINVLGSNGGTPYGAQLCNNYEIDSGGNTPCQGGNTCYSDWFMPARDQLNCLYTNKNSVGGFANSAYWTSTEFSSSPNGAGYQVFNNGAQSNLIKFNAIRVRCVRAFTP